MGEEFRRQVDECANYIAARLDLKPEWGIVLGTGQKLLVEHLESRSFLSYEELPHFPWTTTPTHEGRLWWGYLGGRPVLLFQGRVHAYEGYPLSRVAMSVRVMAALGVKKLILTNAAGGLNPRFKAGELMVLCDHLNFLGDNPLVGENVESWGPRFPDMTRVYDAQLRELAENVALKRGISLQRGVYVAVKGPSLETPAETRFLRMSGADAVGMSTVAEAIAAVHAGLKVLGLSIISNVNLPDVMAPVTLEDIVATVKEAEPRLVQLIQGVVEEA
uniref:Purine nucleoside phosphorylase n=1 Tax=Desulfobacca acetoxidans TaxID=60893 RepID=A0A7C5ENH8_9BACT